MRCMQVSFADVVLINKTDLVNEEQLQQVAFHVPPVQILCFCLGAPELRTRFGTDASVSR